VEFTDGVDYNEFKELQAIADSWKANKKVIYIDGASKTVIGDEHEVMSMSVTAKKNRLTTRQFVYSKGGIGTSTRAQNADMMRQY